MDNSLELKVSLRVNDSMSDLRTQLTQIEDKLRNVKLNATLDIGNSQKIIDQRIDKLSNSVKKLRLTADLDYGKSKQNLSQAINKLNNSKINVDVNAKVNDKSLNQTVSKVKKATKSVGDIEFNVKDFQTKMGIAVKQLQQSKSHSFKNGELDGFLKSVNELTITTPNLNKRMTELRTQLRGISVEAKQVESSLGTAVKGMMLWSATATAVYFPIRTAREFGGIIVDLDTKMTELKKVMDQNTDFTSIFEQATSSATKFGQSISEAMDSYIEFAKQGFKGDELQKLADSALVASNVADISAQQASQYLTASLIQWNKTANESMGIIDSWNNISNQFATTSENLAQGQAKAGSVAKGMNQSFDELNAVIGTVTSSMKISGNEAGNFWKSALPRLTSQPGMDALAKVGVSLTDKEGNLRNVMQVYTDVANKMKDISETEQIAVTEGLAGKYHIAKMKSLLSDLSSTKSMYREMYQASVDSAGSASKENET